MKNVSFTIEKGEIVGLLGHNGAGKSTVMKMLSGYLEPSKGSVQINDLDMVKNRTQAQRQIGYLPESLPIYGEMKVIDYLDYLATLRGFDASSIHSAITATDLSDKITQPIETLSRGYKQRVAVAGSIIGEPKVLILDEPTNGLDPTQTLLMRQLIQSISQHTTVILSTHIMQEVEAICSRVLLMNRGELKLDTPLKALHQTNILDIETNATSDDMQTIQSYAEVKEVEKVENPTSNRFTVRISESNDEQDLLNIAAMINQQLNTDGFKVYQIQHQKRDLESLFKY